MADFIKNTGFLTQDKIAQHDDSPYSHTSLGDNKKRRRIRPAPVSRTYTDLHTFDSDTESTLSVGETNGGVM